METRRDCERDLNSLLQIWDLDEVDTKSEYQSLLTASATDDPVSMKNGCQGVTKHCSSCYALNVHDANWCIECGVSFLTSSRTTVKESESYSQTHCESVKKSFSSKRTKQKIDQMVTPITDSIPKQYWEASIFYSQSLDGECEEAQCLSKVCHYSNLLNYQ